MCACSLLQNTCFLQATSSFYVYHITNKEHTTHIYIYVYVSCICRYVLQQNPHSTIHTYPFIHLTTYNNDMLYHV